MAYSPIPMPLPTRQPADKCAGSVEERLDKDVVTPQSMQAEPVEKIGVDPSSVPSCCAAFVATYAIRPARFVDGGPRTNVSLGVVRRAVSDFSRPEADFAGIGDRTTRRPRKIVGAVRT